LSGATYWIAAAVAEGHDIAVEGAALVAQHFAGMERVGLDRRAAGPAGRAQVMKALERAALALPVADRIVDKVQLRQATEIGNREDRVEHALQTQVFAFVGQQVHLQKALVGFLLNLDQIRDRDGSADLGKIHALAVGTVG
jgi:hypothetical protein